MAKKTKLAAAHTKKKQPTPSDDHSKREALAADLANSEGLALLGAFDRFYQTLEATTVPAQDGGRRVDGVPHAVALSEAVDALFLELRKTSQRVVEQSGEGIAEYPDGIALQESDSPDGPWTPIHARDTRITTVSIGGTGADAVLLAALDSATRVTAFPLNKWNTMQAASPSASHHRFHAGEVVLQADLDVLASAAKLMRMKKPLAQESKAINGEYRPAATFSPKCMASRLRKAAAKSRKIKQVDTRTIDGVVCYSVEDARRWWPRDVP